MTALTQLLRWLAAWRFTLCVVEIRRGQGPAERELRELALDHSQVARQLLERLEEGGLVLRRMGPKLPDPPRASPAEGFEGACRDPGDGKVDALCSEREGGVRVPVGGKPCERWEWPHTSPTFRLYGPHHQRAETVAAQGFRTGSAGSLPRPQGEAS